jgi:hypothetical protein
LLAGYRVLHLVVWLNLGIVATPEDEEVGTKVANQRLSFHCLQI